ncbi:MAG: 30S ribosomal protein S6 [Clostridiales Family XIII bacterium]|nr:30S ribosomal protein S6 [Clostridiales Family XIII bacterium]
MNSYEILFVLAAALAQDEERKNAAVELVKTIIADGGTVSSVDELGLKKLAYPIQKKNEGYYVLIEFEAPADLPKELDRRLRISDDVIRHIIINKNEK